MAPDISRHLYPITTGLCGQLFPFSAQAKDGFHQLNSSTSLAHLYEKPMDNYLKQVMRHFKHAFDIYPKIEVHIVIEVAFSVHSPQGVHELRSKFEIQQLYKLPHPTALQALGILNQGLLQSNIFLKNVIQLGSDSEIGEGEIEKLKRLKSHLLTLIGFLDGVLMHYSNPHMGCNVPDPDLIKRNVKNLRDVVSKLNPTKFDNLIPDIPITEEDILCSVLGLEREIARKLRELSPEVRTHQTDTYFLLRFLEEHGEYSESLTDTDKVSNLQEMGFTENRSLVIAKWIDEQPFPEHQSLLAWAQHYVETLFKYDIFLNDYVPQYPYREEILNEWCVVSVDRDKEDDDDDGGGGDDGVVTSDVSVINTTNPEEASRFIEEKIHDIPQDPRRKFYFHGTDHRGAQSILEDGINLGASKCRRDFSDGKGFYLSESSNRALKWSKKSEAGAVLVFNISEDCLNDYRCLDLSSGQRDEDCKMVKKHYRTGSKISKSLKQECRNCDYIKGPVSHADAQQRQHQICIREEAMADSIGNPANICAVIFMNTKGQRIQCEKTPFQMGMQQ